MFDVHDKLPVCHDIRDAKVRTKDVILDEEVKFSSFLLEEPIQQGLAKCGFKFLSPIQNNALPLALTGKSIIVHSKSGTGKTLVYLLTALNLYLKSKPKTLFTLILAPTREIAKQVYDVCKNLSSFIKDLKVEYFIGGIPVDIDVIKCKNCHIAIGAPGRIKHLIALDELKVKELQLLVLDEVDLLVNNKEFAIGEIISVLPVSRQTIVCTATYTDIIGALLKPISADFQYINMNEEIPHESASLTSNMLLGVKQYLLPVLSDSTSVDVVRKRSTLVDVLKNVQYDQCFIFVNYISLVKSIHNSLLNNNLPAVWLSSEQNQSTRMANLNKLRLNESKILVTTDLAARGIDIHNANLVINLGLPTPPDVYIHRMGRAGRYGSQGSVITIVSEGEEQEMFKLLLSHVITEPVNLYILPHEIKAETLNSALTAIKCVPERDNIVVREFIAKHTAKVSQSVESQIKKKKKQRKRKTKVKLPEGCVAPNTYQSEDVSSSRQKEVPESRTTISYSKKLEKRLSDYADYFERKINHYKELCIQPNALMELAKPKKSSHRKLVFTDYYQIPDVEEDCSESENANVDSVPICESLLSLAQLSRDENAFIDSQRMPLKPIEFFKLLDIDKAIENGKNSSKICQLKKKIFKMVRDILEIPAEISGASSLCNENNISRTNSDDQLLKSASSRFSTSTNDSQEPPAKLRPIYRTRNEAEDGHTSSWLTVDDHTSSLNSSSLYTPRRSFQPTHSSLEQGNLRLPTAVNRTFHRNMSQRMLKPVDKAKQHERLTATSNVQCPSCYHKFSICQNSVNSQRPDILASLRPFVSSEIERKIYQSHFSFISRSVERGSRYSHN